ncbi:MAG: glutathione S-transferase family protein [Hyphomicrobiaceae bacterium]|nr:glutathione S-transferase family protein [Hyphomicrobiaceae bacterium]
MLTIYGNDHSSCAQKVLWCAEELGLAYTLIEKGGSFGGLDDPEYVRLNPNRLIPTIVDDGLVLWESSAILCHLSAKYGQGSLYPADPRPRGEAYKWVFWQSGTVRSAIMPLYMQWRVWKPAYRHLEELERLRRAMEPVWRIVESHLSSNRWLAGDSFSMADIPMGIMAHWWYSFPIDHFELPHMGAWHARLLERPAFRKTVVQPLAHAD